MLKDFTLRWAILYICWNARIEVISLDTQSSKSHHVIVITSRDFAILLLYRCLRHFHTEHELRTIFHHFNSFKKRSKISDCTFLKIFLQTKIFFFTHFLYAKSTFNNDRKLYKKRWCDLMRIWLFNFHWNRI